MTKEKPHRTIAEYIRFLDSLPEGHVFAPGSKEAIIQQRLEYCLKRAKEVVAKRGRNPSKKEWEKIAWDSVAAHPDLDS